MLIIRRHPGESIQIGEDVELVVVDCGPGRVKLGIRAPQHVAVMRSEVKATREQNLAAARAIAMQLPPGWKPGWADAARGPGRPAAGEPPEPGAVQGGAARVDKDP